TLAKIGTLLDIVALISIPIVTSLLIYNRFRTKKILRISNLPLPYLAILGIAVGFIGILISFAPLFSIAKNSIPIPDYAYEILVLLSTLSPILIFFLILGAPVKLSAGKFLTRIFRIKSATEPPANCI